MKQFSKKSEMSTFAKNVSDDSIKSLFKKDYTLAENIVSKVRTITTLEAEAIREIQTEIKQADISNIRMIMESIRRTAEYASDIAEIVPNLNINQNSVGSLNYS
ncbi:MAG: PhoU domain-containing protein [Candidatus Bathyarchaeia archaeon]